MKYRISFVANSSSSSFMIAAKGEVTKERILDIIDVPEGHLLYSFAKDIAGVLSHTLEVYDSVAAFVAEKARDHYTYDEITERWEKEIELLEQGYTVYEGIVTDESYDGAEVWVCHNCFQLEGPDIIIKSEGGH